MKNGQKQRTERKKQEKMHKKPLCGRADRKIAIAKLTCRKQILKNYFVMCYESSSCSDYPKDRAKIETPGGFELGKLGIEMDIESGNGGKEGDTLFTASL